MNIPPLAGLAFGLSLFLYGMTCTEKALKLLAGPGVRHALDLITRNRVAALLAGIALTLATQSSSATTVMLVGFAGAGLLAVPQAVPVVLGSAVATTLTVQLLAWRVTDAGPAFAAAGFFLSLFSARPRLAQTGRLLFGFGLVFYGMALMSASVAPVRSAGLFHAVLRHVDSPLGLLLAATLFTAVIQSSAATVALVIGLAASGAADGAAVLTLDKCVPLVLGADIGTSATALLASLRAPLAGKRIAWAHLIYKVLLASIALPCAGLLVRAGEWSSPHSTAHQIANLYTICNTAGAVLFLPVTGLLARLAALLLPVRSRSAEGYSLRFIDRDFHELPDLALGQAHKEAVRMSGLVCDMLEGVWRSLSARDGARLDLVRAQDSKVDYLQESISQYLTALGQREIRAEESLRQMCVLAVVSELELIGDVISKDLCGSVEQLLQRGLFFSAEGMSETEDFYRRVRLELYRASDALAGADPALAQQVIASQPALDALHDQLREKHFSRLAHGAAQTLQTTTIHLDVLDDLRRVNTHSARICLAITRQHAAAGRSQPASDLTPRPSDAGA